MQEEGDISGGRHVHTLPQRAGDEGAGERVTHGALCAAERHHSPETLI